MIQDKFSLLSFILISCIVTQSLYSQTNKSIYNHSDYSYYIGESLAHSLFQGCSIFAGSIDNTDDPSISLIIKETIFGEPPDENSILLNYTEPRPLARFRSESYSPWILVDVKKGNELIVSNCKGKNGIRKYGLIVSDTSLFPGIRESISHFEKYRETPEILLKTSQYVDKYKDEVFSGYIILLLTRYGTNVNKNYSALVLSELIENEKMPKPGFAFAIVSLQRFLVREDDLKIDVKKKLIKRLIDAGSSKKSSATQAIYVLLRVADDNRLDLRPFLNKRQKKLLLENYRANKDFLFRMVSAERKSKFENLLLLNE